MSLHIDSKRDRFYSITIDIQTGFKQNYALFSYPPEVTPDIEDITNNIISGFFGVAGGTEQVFFTMPKQKIFAIRGTSNRDGLEDGVKIEYLEKKAVTLGHLT